MVVLNVYKCKSTYVSNAYQCKMDVIRGCLDLVPVRQRCVIGLVIGWTELLIPLLLTFPITGMHAAIVTMNLWHMSTRDLRVWSLWYAGSWYFLRHTNVISVLYLVFGLLLRSIYNCQNQTYTYVISFIAAFVNVKREKYFVIQTVCKRCIFFWISVRNLFYVLKDTFDLMILIIFTLLHCWHV